MYARLALRVLINRYGGSKYLHIFLFQNLLKIVTNTTIKFLFVSEDSCSKHF